MVLDFPLPTDVAQGQVEFVDTRENKRSGNLTLKPVQVVIAGAPHGRPYPAPFSIRRRTRSS